MNTGLEETMPATSSGISGCFVYFSKVVGAKGGEEGKETTYEWRKMVVAAGP